LEVHQAPYGVDSLSKLRSKIIEICDDYLCDYVATDNSTTAAEHRSELEWWNQKLSQILNRWNELSADDKQMNKRNLLASVMNRNLPINQNQAVQDELEKQGLVGPALREALLDRKAPDRPWRMAPDVLKDMALMRDAVGEELSAGNPLEAREKSAWDKWVWSLGHLLKKAGLEVSI
jgi:hypothetical protein